MLAYKGAMSYGARWMFSWGEKKDEKDNNDKCCSIWITYRCICLERETL